MKTYFRARTSRRAVTRLLVAFMMIVLLGMLAFGLDIGYIVLVRTQLQAAADSAAMASASVLGGSRFEVVNTAREYAGYHEARGKSVQLLDEDIEYGTWDTATRTFSATSVPGNAIRVTAKRDDTVNGEAPLFVSRLLGHGDFKARASAVAMVNPRDLVFVIDGSDSALPGMETSPRDLTSDPLLPFCPLGGQSPAAGETSPASREEQRGASRQALVDAMRQIQARNLGIPNAERRDWVSIVTFDPKSPGKAVVSLALTANYDLAIQACENPSLGQEPGAASATEAVLLAAERHVASAAQGGKGRDYANQVVILITDGRPQIQVSSQAEVAAFQKQQASKGDVVDGNQAQAAALMQTMRMRQAGIRVFPVGLGSHVDVAYLHRLARAAGTADAQGHAVSGIRDPAETEPRISVIFQKILAAPQVRLVQ